jgi:excisionase family DNA binding protein
VSAADNRLLVTTRDACALLSVSRSTIRNLVQRGALVPVKLGTVTRYKLSDLLALANGEVRHE